VQFDDEGVDAGMAVRSKASGKHSLKYWIFLHLLPALPILWVYMWLAPGFVESGYPPLYVKLMALPLVIIPVMLAILLFIGWKTHAQFSLRGIVGFQKPMAGSIYRWAISLLFLFSVAVLLLRGPLDDWFQETVFAWLPTWFFFEEAVDMDSVPAAMKLTVFVLGLSIYGVVEPIMEEVYFRGFLLPRSPLAGWAAPVVHTGLFALYHLYSPWQMPSRFLLFLPLVLVVWRTRNIYVGMVVHVLINVTAILLLLIL